MRTKLNFKEIASKLQGYQTKEVISSDLTAILKSVGLPVDQRFRKILMEDKILLEGQNGTYIFGNDSIFEMNVEHAYREYRKQRNKYIKNLKNRTVSEPDADEQKIQNAIAILKSQGDRFKIVEKIVTVNYKEL